MTFDDPFEGVFSRRGAEDAEKDRFSFLLRFDAFSVKKAQSVFGRV
jgi:hypothetical protein